jgi:FAD/FMN-containing dehydrogenase
METREYDGVRVDGLDGTAFRPGEYYLTLATWTEQADTKPSDYVGQQIYYRSIQQREHDLLTMYDYLWRWDTDWFWCSRAFGTQHRVVRRLWPRRYKRSDVYYRMVRLDQRLHVGAWLDRRRGNPEGERVVQDVEIPVERLGEFLDWFDAEVGMRPVWLCPLFAGKKWPTYPLRPDEVYVNVGFWGNVGVGPDAPNAPLNRAIETKVHELDGHKSLYSEAFYDAETFEQLYDGANLAHVKDIYDPDHRLTSLYDKAVRRR